MTGFADYLDDDGRPRMTPPTERVPRGEPGAGQFRQRPAVPRDPSAFVQGAAGETGQYNISELLDMVDAADRRDRENAEALAYARERAAVAEAARPASRAWPIAWVLMVALIVLGVGATVVVVVLAHAGLL